MSPHTPVTVPASVRPSGKREVDVERSRRVRRRRAPCAAAASCATTAPISSSTGARASPGGSVPARELGLHAVLELGAGEHALEQSLPDAPLAERRRARPAARPAPRRSNSLTLIPSRSRRNARTGCSTNRTRLLELDHSVVGRGSGAGRNGTRALAGAAQRAARPASACGSKLHGPAGRRARRRVKLRGSNGCSGWLDHDLLARRAVARARTVRSTTSSSSPTGTAGGRRRLVRSSLPGVGDDQPLGRGQQRVEQHLAVLGARVAVADVRLGAAAGRRRRGGARRGNSPSSRPSTHTTRWGTERIGTSVQTVRWPVRKFARVGRPRSRSASSARTSASSSSRPPARAPSLASATTSSSRRWSSRRCQESRSLVAVSASAAPAIGVRPAVDRSAARRARRPPRWTRSTNSANRPARSIAPLLDVVERQHAADEPPILLGHRDADQHPVEAAPPRVRRRATSSLNGSRCAASSPQRIPLADDPLLHPREVVVVEAEAPAHRLAVGQVEQLRGGRPLVGEREQLADDAEHRVGLPQRAVGEPDAEVGQALVASGGVVLVVARSARARAERGLDQRRERLDVRAHHDHVARLERRVVLEQVQDRVAERPRPGARGRGRRGPGRCGRPASSSGRAVGLARERRPGRLAVLADVCLDRREQRVRLAAAELVVVIDGARRRARARAAARATSRPQEASSRLTGSAAVRSSRRS